MIDKPRELSRGPKIDFSGYLGILENVDLWDRFMFGFLKKCVSPFTKIKSLLGQQIRSLFGKKIDESSYAELEKLFYEADLGASLAAELVERVRALLKKSPGLETEQILQAIQEDLLSLLGPAPEPLPLSTRPHVILLVGVNGSGKTTTLAKLAAYYRNQKKSVLVAAGDTFRAASVEQLERWTTAVGAELVKSAPASDPSAVVFDALSAALARDIDVVLIDTAGRLQTKTELMQELAKIRRICNKQIPGSPHETLLVIDATMGQNAIDQASTFHNFTPLSGIIVTKLDGTAKGGIAISIQRQLKIPIRWIGIGEGAEDLQPFDPVPFVHALLT